MSRLGKDEWKSVDRLFEECLSVTAEECDRILEASHASRSVQARVRALLIADRSAQSRIGESAEALARDLFADGSGGPKEETDDRGDTYPPGSLVGPYKVERELGRGGMGRVYLARRSDEQFERLVAVKVVKRGMDTDEVLERFKRERQILARLEHPGIGRMYDAGATTEGRPYLVLEYVEGAPIDSYCDAERLGVDERLRLFVQVCDALSYAHQKLVLHLDLKPSNILVTDAGPRLLDFGIGAMIDDREGGSSGSLTALAGRRLTPDYASPEQFAGSSVSTASDVYSLGVILHELLTGARPERETTTDSVPTSWGPVQRPSTTFTDPRRTSDETSRSASSRGSTPHRLARRLQGDLDVILLRAVHEDCDRRYPSVEALSQDVRRHLEGFPVRARPDSLSYRARKFVLRNRLPVLSGSGIGFATLVFGVSMLFQQAETKRERDRADQERVLAEEVAQVMEELFKGAGFDSRDRVDKMTVRTFLDQSAAQVIEELEGQPIVQGALLRILGSAQNGLGNLDRADSLLTRSNQVLEAAAGPGSRPLLMAQRDLAHLRLRQGRFEEARALYLVWLELHPDLSDADRAAALHNVAISHIELREFRAAAAASDSSLAIHRRDPALDPMGYANALSVRSGIAQAEDDMELAVPLALEGWQTAVRELGPDHPTTLALEHNYAFCLRHAGRREEAEPVFVALLARYGREVGEDTPDYVTLLTNYGSLLREMGRLEEALDVLSRSTELDRILLGPTNPNRLPSLNSLARTLRALGRREAALEVFAEQWRIADSVLGPEHDAATSARAAILGIADELEQAGTSAGAVAAARALVNDAGTPS